ncbi:AI-2E family transporter [Niameybacter massiliensis]|uniref:AI-2E family transporter n=1 Tax=Niameybacter massiliensis TaxID=1658108 RepID=UPI0006B65FB0|nr:AI-2E family transporter [Niameybacter massiliensis]
MEIKKENLKKIFFGIIAIIIFYWALQNNIEVMSWINNGISLFAPIILGLAIAFLINIPMRAIEKTFFRKQTETVKKIKRPISLVLSMVLMVSIVILVMVIIVPELIRTILIIKDSVPGFVIQVQNILNNLLEHFPDLANQITVSIDWAEIGKKILEWVQHGAAAFAGSTFSAISATFSGVFTFVLGLVLAIYVLLQKEKLAMQVRKVFYAYGKERRVDEVLRIIAIANKAFSNFFTGQCLEAVIIGVLFFITMSLTGFPYALMISVTIGFTALIPIFGAFLGCFIGVFLILVTSPVQAVWFIILFLILQQVEGNFIYPRVVGGSIGLPGIWVLIAVTIGGNMFGVLGMLVMVPMCSVIYTLLREDTYKRLNEKHVNNKKIEGKIQDNKH